MQSLIFTSDYSISLIYLFKNELCHFILMKSELKKEIATLESAKKNVIFSP
jgi:hypothetical protein